MDLLNRFKENWKQKALAQAGETILLAVSGGIDSMVMVHLFFESKIPFAIAHCNFQLRGEDADRDEQLVRNWANKHNTTFHSIRFNTKEKAEEWKKGTQETARILRYEWLDNIRIANDYSRLATAHHANDNAETLLMNLFRGTGISGLHGIKERNDKIIRPLLFAKRSDIEQYVTENKIDFREDASNASDNYLRNAVRHHIIPAAEKWFDDPVLQINETIQRIAEAEIIYKRAIEKELKQLTEQRGKDIYIPILKLKKKQPLNTICYELFSRYGFTPATLPFIIQMIDAESGKFVESETHRIIKDRDFLIITPKVPTDADIILIEGVPCIIETEAGHFHFSIEKKPENISADINIAILDTKNISFPLILRKWRTGDYFYPFGMGMKKKKLSKFFIDQKVPLHQKDNTWILECDKRIAWVAGMRLDERFRVKVSTEQVLRVEFKPR